MARRAATAATAAAVSLAGVGTSAAEATPAEGAATVEEAAGNAGASPSQCDDPHTPPSQPSDLVEVGGTLFFTADDGIHGRELWKSDGTEAGTVLVKDIDPDDGYNEYGYDAYGGPYSLTGVGGTLFFTADDGVHGREVWKSDGTEAGTVLVKDIRRGARQSDPTYLTGVGSTLFFTARDGTHGQELWKSDGTRAGTVQVKDIDPDDDYYRYPKDLTGVGETLFFSVDDGVHGRELWKSDGTRAGTVLVKDIDPDDGYDEYGGPSSLSGVGSMLFFAADDGAHGVELWKSDGTEAGTVLVKDIHPDIYNSFDSYPYLIGVGGTLFFTARDGTHGQELWKSDGTEAGTVLVEDIRPGARRGDPTLLSGVGGTLFFAADDGIHGRELWKSDGTETGTVLVKDIDPADDDYYSGPSSLSGVGGTLFFAADDGTHGRELWKSDGTESGTVLVKDIRPGARRGYPTSLTGAGDTLYFTAGDGTHGSELWASDGTEAGTVLVKDVNAGGQFRVASNGRANPRTGTMRVKVTVAGSGRLVVRPLNRAPVARSVREVTSAGTTAVKLRPTKAGMRKLKRALREAHRDGRQVGKLRVKARFTFIPCGGSGSSVIRRYTLRLR